jgi:cobalt-zinc-cadmium efflux system outer membrane protein
MRRHWMLLSVFALAGPAHALTLEDAVQQALNTHPRLKAARQEWQILHADRVLASTLPNPALLSDNGVPERTYRLGIEQLVELGGKRAKRVALAEARQGAVLANLRATAIELRTQVRQAFVNLQLLNQRQQAATTMADNAKRLFGIARAREQAGAISQLEVLQAEVAVVQAENELARLQNELLQAQNTLNSLLSQPFGTPLTIDALPGLPPVLAWEDTALAQRPEMLTLQSQLAVTQAENQLARAERIPDLLTVTGFDAVFDNAGNDYGVFVIAGLELPIFDRQQGPLLRAMARREQLQAEQAALTQRIRLEVANALLAVKRDQERVVRLEQELLPRAQTVYQKACLSFDAGKSGILLPLAAQQALVQSQINYLEAMAAYQAAMTQLEQAAGYLPDTVQLSQP